jgi:hypothetical protein
MRSEQKIQEEVIAARTGSNPILTLRLLLDNYTQDELHIAKNHFGSIPADPLGMVVQQAIERLRHLEMTDRIAALENPKPHWTLVPTFWAVIGTGFIGIIGIVIACFAWRDPLPTSEGKASGQLLQTPQEKPPVPLKSAITPAPATTNSVAAPASPKH